MANIITAPESDWVEHVLDFWFGELQPARWFKSDDAIDDAVRARFTATHDTIAETFDVVAGMASPRRALATVIVLDQFPRNIFRGTGRAFATDPLARATASDAVSRQLDKPLSMHERLFLYLPFEHSEALADQHRAVDLISSLGDAHFTRYAEAHRDIIARFGRFPHRNAILGRISTPEELAFLQQPNSSF